MYLSLSTYKFISNLVNDTKIAEILYSDDTISFSIDSEIFSIETITDTTQSDYGRSYLVIKNNTLINDANTINFNIVNDTVITVESFELYQIDFAIKYIDNVASKENTYPVITIHGYGFDSTFNVNLVYYDGNVGSCIQIDNNELTITNTSISFTLFNKYLIHNSNNNEICTVYDICVKTGLCGTICTGSCAKLIRYKYNSDNISQLNYGCYYANNMNIVYDTSDSISSGSSGKYGKTMYYRLTSNIDCNLIKYYYVRLKYNERLSNKYGEILLNNIQLLDGDIVWLSSQYVDDEDGLWMVHADDWTYICNVDEYTFIDLGVRVTDTIKLKYDQQISKYGIQTINTIVLSIGDLILLTNQTDTLDNGIWRVQCNEWEYVDNTILTDGNIIDLTKNVITVTDLDFCTCGIYHIWYYYLNGSCYLNTQIRTIKVLTSTANLIPCNNINISDYYIQAGVDKNLTNYISNGGTNGDPIKETCTIKNTNIDSLYRLSTDNTKINCLDSNIYNPICKLTPECYTYIKLIGSNILPTTRDYNSFSIVFCKYYDNIWWLYAYIATGTYQSGMTYVVYELSSVGSATTDMITTYDTWFTDTYDSNGNYLSTSTPSNDFTIYDSNWIFVDENNNITTKLREYTLHQNWAIKPTTYIGGIDGMFNIYDARFYKTAITKQDFVDIYNTYTCITGFINVLATDDNDYFITDDESSILMI